MKFFSSSRTFGAVFAALVLAFGVIGTTQAQQGGNPQQEFQQLQQRLMTIQQQAFENNPQLQDEAEALEDLVISTMQDAGFDAEGGLARLEQLQQEFEGEDLADDRRQSIVEEAQEIQMELQEGQQLAMQDDDVIQAQERFENNLLDAMRAEDPETDDLLETFEQMQAQMMQQMQQMQPQGQPQPQQ